MKKISVFVFILISLSAIESLGANWGLDNDSSAINVFLLERIALKGSLEWDSKTIALERPSDVLSTKKGQTIDSLSAEYSISPFNICYSKKYTSDNTTKHIKLLDDLKIFIGASHGNTATIFNGNTLNIETERTTTYKAGVRIETTLKDVFGLFR